MHCRLQFARRHIRLTSVAALLLPLLAATSPLAAQAPAESPPAGSIRGSVVDAGTMMGLGGTTVTLVPQDGAGALPPTARDPYFAGARTTTTTQVGEYLFASLAPGRYTMLVRRVGYEPVRVDVELSTGDASRLSIGLLVHPIALQAIDVRADRRVANSDRSLAYEDTAGRIAAARERQQEFLGSDVRELTTADVREAVTLGSTDILHALQRLPGVTHTTDLQAPVWVRGNRWDHTRVYFDGLPLFHPLSALAGMSGVGAAAVGAAFLLPGVQPVSLGGGSAARIDLRSAPGVSDGRLHGDAGLSRYGGHASLGYRAADDGAGVLLTARQGLMDLFSASSKPAGFSPDMYRYDELTARGDARNRFGHTESSGLYSRDTQSRFMEDNRNRRWQSIGGRLTHHVPIGTLLVSANLGAMSFVSRGEDYVKHRVTPDEPPSWTWKPSSTGVRHISAGMRVGRESDDPNRRWQAGVDATRITADFIGPRRLLLSGDSTAVDTSGTMTGAHVSVWAERRWRPWASGALEAGLRLDLGGAGLSSSRPSFGLQLRHAISGATSLSLGAGRALQYLQQVERPHDWWRNDSAQPWLLAGGEVPLLTVDHMVAGVERWNSSGILLASNLFVRRSDGVVMRDPRPGSLAGRPFFVTGREVVGGVELSARKLTGRVTGMVSYSFQHGAAMAEGLSFSVPGARPHAFDVTAMTRLGAWRLGGGLTLASGAPRTTYRGSGWWGDRITGTEFPFDPGEVGEPSGQRNLGYAGADLFVDWTRQLRHATLTLLGGTRVVFPAEAGVGGYRSEGCFQGTSGDGWHCRMPNPDRRTYMVAPTLGVRIAF
jgi:hypothetical protein